MGRGLDSLTFARPNQIEVWLQNNSLATRRNLFWSWYEPRNFGDWIGPYLFKKITGKRPLHLAGKRMRFGPVVFSVGSILRKIVVPDQAIVWGSGIITYSDQFQRPLKVLAVRGPRSQHRLEELGYEVPTVVGDPAILMPKFYSARSDRQKGRIGIVPHFFDADDILSSELKAVHIIDVRKSVEDVVDAIAGCDLIFSSSLHGIIISHAYGVPAVWIKSLRPISEDDSKFVDYYESVGVFGQEAMQIALDWDSDTFREKADLATVPQLDKMRAELIKCCPFC